MCTTSQCFGLAACCVVFALLHLQFFAFRISGWACAPVSKPGRGTRRLLVIADPHLLGRRRGWADVNWVDWQVRRSVEYTLGLYTPDALFLLGDIFDNGRRSDDAEWQDNKLRYDHVFGRPARAAGVRVFTTVGNHDTGNGYQLRRPAVQHWESVFGPTNWQQLWKGNEANAQSDLTVVAVDTMALTGTPRAPELAAEARRFVTAVAEERSPPSPVQPPLLLLLHLPLYRANDTDCGPERSREGGHVTYSHPSERLQPGSDVLSATTSQWLLDKLRPALLLSGHTHAVCRRRHDIVAALNSSGDDSGATALEFTVPAFGWRMRPDPGFMVVDVESAPAAASAPASGARLAAVTAHYCQLPHEHVTLAIVATLGVAAALASSVGIALLLWQSCNCCAHCVCQRLRRKKTETFQVLKKSR